MKTHALKIVLVLVVVLLFVTRPHAAPADATHALAWSDQEVGAPGVRGSYAGDALTAFAFPASAATVIWPSAPIPDIETGHSPNAEDFNGRFYVATVSNTFPEDSRFQLSSTPLNVASPTWTTQLLVPPSDPDSSLAIKVWNSRLWLAYRAQNSLIYVTSSKNGQTWGAWTPIPGSDHNELGRGAVSLKGIGAKLYLAARGIDGGVEITWRTSGGSWRSFTTVPASATNYRPALTEFNDKLTLGIVGLDGQVLINRSSNGTSWGSWIHAPALGFGGEEGTTPLVANAGPGLTVYNGKLYVGVRVGDFDIEDSLQIAAFNGSAWSEWLPGPAITGEPSLTTAEGDLFLTTQDWDSATVRVERVRD